uniref:Uncharacterized protein n=1 Tax=Siphoviridae sp. ctgmM3 TaxID=2827912 RepID=A0A8S5TL25_9CAUD|nr:MAG TPA: hypothetical protein [Siphoviridae sp. ctgmM3]
MRNACSPDVLPWQTKQIFCIVFSLLKCRELPNFTKFSAVFQKSHYFEIL